MKISLNWLKEYIKITLPPQKLADRLTMAGLEVEKMTSLEKDTVYELEVTPNRADCLNYLGVAREISAALNLPLQHPKIKKIPNSKNKLNITILDKKGCSQYVGILIRDIVISDSPDWLQKFLNSIGSKSINNVVDCTNFCLMENGQPLHAFDFDKLDGEKIIVRKAFAGESITTIDGVERKLDPSILVIADANKPVAIAGIMGGKETEVTSTTKNILLESAYFDPLLIRRTGRKLGLSTDSSYRFERGINFAGVKSSAHRAVSLILELAKGRVHAQKEIMLEKQRLQKKKIKISVDTVNRRLGSDLSAHQCQMILKRLGCEVALEKKNILSIIVPSWRNDLKIDVDIIEEVARVTGYDNLPESVPSIKARVLEINKVEEVQKKIKKILVGQGVREVITFTMIDQKMLNKTQLENVSSLKIINPLSKDLELMRPSLFPSLLAVIQTNINRGQKDIKIFEIGKEYSRGKEHEVLVFALSGVRADDWRRPKQETDFFDVKGVVETILNLCQEKKEFLGGESKLFKEQEFANVSLAGEEIAVFGKVHSSVLSGWDIKQKNIYMGRIDLEKLVKYADMSRSFHSIPDYPSITRDTSLAIKQDIPFQKVLDLIQALNPQFFSKIQLLEEYRGEKVDPSHKGITFSILYRSTERTLREDEVDATHQKVCDLLIKELPAIKR